MLTSTLVGVWLLSATWLQFDGAAGEVTALSEPYGFHTYDTRGECETAAKSKSDELTSDKSKLLKLLTLFPGANAIGFKCTQQAEEM